MNGVKKVLIAGVLVTGCAVAGLAALGGSVAPLVAFRDVAKRSGTVEVYGKLDKTSIRPLRGYNLVAFDLVEEKTGNRLELMYDNPGSGLPANFPTASHVKATGVYNPVSHKLVTDQVMTKCPSKYKQEDMDVTTKTAIEKWEKAKQADVAKVSE